MIACHSVVVEFGRGELRRRVLDRLDCAIAPRAQLVVLGQRGAGKTTLLNALAGQLIPTGGWVERHGKIAPPTGLLRFASRQSSPRQYVALVSRLYGVNYNELLDFVTAFSQIGWLIDKPLAVIPNMHRQQFNSALTYGVPFDFYMLDGSVGKGRQQFRELCQQAFDKRRRSAGVVFATSNVRHAAQIGGDGAIIHRGKVTLYPTLQHAIDEFQAMPKEEISYNFEQQPEEPGVLVDDGVF